MPYNCPCLNFICTKTSKITGTFIIINLSLVVVSSYKEIIIFSLFLVLYPLIPRITLSRDFQDIVLRANILGFTTELRREGGVTDFPYSQWT